MKFHKSLALMHQFCPHGIRWVEKQVSSKLYVVDLS